MVGHLPAKLFDRVLDARVTVAYCQSGGMAEGYLGEFPLHQCPDLYLRQSILCRLMLHEIVD